MFVSQDKIISILFGLIISILVPIFWTAYVRTHTKGKFINILWGALIWVVFSQVFEKIMHVAVFGLYPGLLSVGVFLAVYGAFMAGLFEGLGRFVGLKWLSPKAQNFDDALAMGVGHGGMEALAVAFSGNLTLLSFALNLNNLGEAEIQKQIPQNLYNALINSLNSPNYYFILAGVERFFASIIHIFFYIILLKGLQTKNLGLIIASFALHMLFDLLPGLYQAGLINSIPLVETIIGVLALLSFIFIFWSRYNWFKEI